MKAIDAVCEVHSSNIEERPTSFVNSAHFGCRSWLCISEPVGTNGQSINRHTSERRQQSALHLHVYGAIAQACRNAFVDQRSIITCSPINQSGESLLRVRYGVTVHALPQRHPALTI